MIRPNTDIVGKCSECPGTVTRDVARRWPPSCEVCGKHYPRRVNAAATKTTGSICPDCEQYHDEAKPLCPKCTEKRARAASMSATYWERRRMYEKGVKVSTR